MAEWDSDEVNRYAALLDKYFRENDPDLARQYQKEMTDYYQSLTQEQQENITKWLLSW